ncbi:Protein ZBED8 [Holothuria leucospilota]|uniref:Protein ZBED8 n=1 Tax=Holothuria leucospilota TaxID=206669 RepID=A0A9Q1BBI4_HOLLE|nr:Protein ZBED8 [Holothuria leucospilota]
MDKRMEASYELSLLIARSGKPHSIGEQLIKPAVGVVLKTVMGKDPNPVLSSIALSNDSVARRIDEMSTDVEDKLCSELRNTYFAIQLDESTLQDSEALLLCYVRFIHDHEMVEEMFARSLQTDTKGSSIFQLLKKYFNDKNIPMENILACATDGAPAMVGRHCGFIALLKNKVPSVFAIHCMVHRQHLVVKSLSPRLHTLLQIVIKAVNKIKASAQNDRLFRQLCQENDEQFVRLLLHTEVRWLSKGNCLTRFHAIFSTVVEFLSEVDTQLSEKVNAIKHDVAYLTDIFKMLNDVNKQLQGDHMTLIKAKKVIGAFITKAALYRETLSRRDMYHFPLLAQETAISDNELLVYCNHLEKIRGDMEERFRDMLELSMPAWVINPFKCTIQDVKRELQDEMSNLHNDDEAKARFLQHEYNKFWILERENTLQYGKRQNWHSLHHTWLKEDSALSWCC